MPATAERELQLPYGLEEVRAERGRRSLESYVKAAWTILEPDTPYHDNWHVGAICYYLEAVTSGEIRNLLINVPPGFMKSLLVSVFWPTWEWGPRDMPHLRYLSASNGRELAVRDTTRARRLIVSDWYQRHYASGENGFELTTDQNRKMRFDNDAGGSRFATSVGGGTGERADRVIFDDPHEIDDVDTPGALKEAVHYNNVTLDSRLADREKSAKVVVQQRVAKQDVSGDILRKMEEGGREYEVVCLPMRHDPAYVASISHRNRLPKQDPRTERGELLDPGRYSETSVAQDIVTFGDQAPAILDQKPQESTASVYKRGDFPRFSGGIQRVRRESVGRWLVIDSAEEDTPGADYTAAGTLDLSPSYRLQLTGMQTDKLEWPDLLPWIEGIALNADFDGKLRGVVIERASSGRQALQTLEAASDHWLSPYISGFDPGTKSKVGRAKRAALWTRQGCVELPMPDDDEWVEPFTEELFSFPDVEHDDRTDTLTVGILWLENILAEGLAFRQGAA